FDFGTDHVLCSYDDFAAHSEPNRFGRPSVKVYEQESYANEDVLSAVERCMKKYADNLLRSLEGITIGFHIWRFIAISLRAKIILLGYLLHPNIFLRSTKWTVTTHKHDTRHSCMWCIPREQTPVCGSGQPREHFTSLACDVALVLINVHRSIQILRDKQELVEAQKELAKFQLTQDESKKKEDVPTPSFPEQKKLEEKPDAAGKQLAFVLRHQVNSSSLAPRAFEPVQQYNDQPMQQTAPSSLVPHQDRYVLSQAIVYYPQHQAPGNQDTQGAGVAMQGPYNTVAPSGGSHSKVQYSYGGPSIPPSQPLPQHNTQRQQLPPPSQGSYVGPPQYVPQGHLQGYNTRYGYPPSGSSHHKMRGHPYGEMVDKAITMGYPRDQVLNVIQRMTDSCQQIDFNALLDRLNESGSGAPSRAW
ncbi:hypothetical protein BRADI_2g50145v3, partial [Brachypodium distachyon]